MRASRASLAGRLAFLLAVSISLSSPIGLHGQAAPPAAAQPRQAPRIDATRQIQDLEALASPALEGRLAGSEGSRKARALIVERFRQLKLQPVGGSFEQPFSFSETRRGSTREFAGAANVIGVVAGRETPQSYVIVSAHYDHLGVRDGKVYPGADDNASGVAALLALAQWFSEHPGRRSILFAAFDGEEEGLQGAKHFVAHPPVELSKVRAIVNMDMLGRGDANTLFASGTRYSPELAAIVKEAAGARALTLKLGHDAPAAQADGVEDWTNSSDHGPFHAAGIPFVYFGVEDHPDYHKPTDTADKIPRRFYQEATELVLDVVSRIADGKE